MYKNTLTHILLTLTHSHTYTYALKLAHAHTDTHTALTHTSTHIHRVSLQEPKNSSMPLIVKFRRLLPSRHPRQSCR